MKKVLITAVALAVVAIVATVGISAKIQVSRHTEPGSRTETLNAGKKFTSVELFGTADYELIADGSKAGIIEVKYNLPKGGMEKIVSIDPKGTTLTINGEFRVPRGVSYNSKASMSIKVYYSTLTGVKASGTGDIKANKISAPEKLNVTLTGTGDFTTGDISTRSLDVRLEGTGDFTSGAIDCSSVKFFLSGTGDFTAKTLTGKDVSMKNTGTGDLSLKKVDCDVFTLTNTGTGDIKINGGSARSLDVKNSGTGSLKLIDFVAGNLSANNSSVGDLIINKKKY